MENKEIKESKLFEKKIGIKPYIFSSTSYDGIDLLIEALFNNIIEKWQLINLKK